MNRLVIAFVACLALGAAPSHANVIYTFTGTETQLTPPGGSFPLVASIEITDDAFASGEVHATIHADGIGTILLENTGVAVLRIIAPSFFVTETFEPVHRVLDVRVFGEYDPTGELRSFDLFYGDDFNTMSDVHVSQDSGPCFLGCSLTGSWSDPVFVPEPGSLYLMVSLLGVIAMLRWRNPEHRSNA